MPEDDGTCWTLVNGAAAGGRDDREDLARRYISLVRAYFRKRWGKSPLIADVDDACQEVFIELFRQGGALDRLEAERARSFRAFLYAVIRNVALRVEERRRGRRHGLPAGSAIERLVDDEKSLSLVFDQLWAQDIVRQTVARLREKARAGSDAYRRRVDLLDLRFGEGRPIRDIAATWGMNPRRVHKDYAQAREEFKETLLEVLSFHNPDSPESLRLELKMVAGYLR